MRVIAYLIVIMIPLVVGFIAGRITSPRIPREDRARLVALETERADITRLCQQRVDVEPFAMLVLDRQYQTTEKKDRK